MEELTPAEARAIFLRRPPPDTERRTPTGVIRHSDRTRKHRQTPVEKDTGTDRRGHGDAAADAVNTRLEIQPKHPEHLRKKTLFLAPPDPYLRLHLLPTCRLAGPGPASVSPSPLQGLFPRPRTDCKPSAGCSLCQRHLCPALVPGPRERACLRRKAVFLSVEKRTQRQHPS